MMTLSGSQGVMRLYMPKLFNFLSFLDFGLPIFKLDFVKYFYSFESFVTKVNFLIALTTMFLAIFLRKLNTLVLSIFIILSLIKFSQPLFRKMI